MNSNIGKVFDDVLSVDAWRTSFDAQSSSANVHVDVSFLRGKLGDEPHSPVRFEIALKRAEIIFVIPANEPIVVVQSSVMREQPVSVTTESFTSRDLKTKGNVAANVNSVGIGLASASGSIAGETADSSRVTTTSGGGPVTWAQSKTSNGDYRWVLAPKVAKIILGKAWDPVARPLLEIRRTDEGRIDPLCRVVIKCRREDIEIIGLEEKSPDRSIRALLSDRSANKAAAAEAYIKNCLTSRNLNIRNFEDPYGELTLAETVVHVGE